MWRGIMSPRLAQPSLDAPTPTRRLRLDGQPLQQWISQLRHTHQKIRTGFYARHNGFSRTPFPETRHFK